MCWFLFCGLFGVFEDGGFFVGDDVELDLFVVVVLGEVEIEGCCCFVGDFVCGDVLVDVGVV